MRCPLMKDLAKTGTRRPAGRMPAGIPGVRRGLREFVAGGAVNLIPLLAGEGEIGALTNVF